MANEKHILQIRNGVFFLCVMSVITLVTGVLLNIHLTNRSLDHFETLSDPTSKGQELINELDQLLQANRIDRLIQRCEGILSEKPLNTPAHYYLGLAWYHSGDAGKALEHLGEARRIDPSWKEAIDPYLEQLREAGQPHGR